MKKLVTAICAGALMLASASIACAAETTVKGSIEESYKYFGNLDMNHGAADYRDMNALESRILLSVDAKVAEGLEGFIEMDTDVEQWGDAAGSVNTYLNHLNRGFSIRQAWINFGVPGTPVGMKIGHQPLALGHGIWLDTSRYGSDAILVYSMPTPQLLLAGAFVQGDSNLPAGNIRSGVLSRLGGGLVPGVLNAPNVPAASFKEDAQFYAVLANYTFMENNTAGVNVTYVNDKNTLNQVGVGVNSSIQAYNTALVLDGKIANLKYKGELDWLNVSAKGLGGGVNYTVNAFAAMIGASMDAGPVNVGMEVAYGTGNDNDTPAVFYNPGAAAKGKKVTTKHRDTAYYTPYNSTSYNYAFLYNDKIGQGPLGSGGGFGFGDGFGGIGLANTGYVKLSVAANATDKLKVGMDALYLRASESMIAGQSKDLGWEIDANASYKLYDNLTLDINGGVFNPGAWYAFAGHANAAPAMRATLTNQADADSPVKRQLAYGLETKLSLKF